MSLHQVFFSSLNICFKHKGAYLILSDFLRLMSLTNDSFAMTYAYVSYINCIQACILAVMQYKNPDFSPIIIKFLNH